MLSCYRLGFSKFAFHGLRILDLAFICIMEYDQGITPVMRVINAWNGRSTILPFVFYVEIEVMQRSDRRALSLFEVIN